MSYTYNFNDDSDSNWFTSPEEAERDGDISIDFARNSLASYGYKSRVYCSRERPWDCTDGEMESSSQGVVEGNQIPQNCQEDYGNLDLDVFAQNPDPTPQDTGTGPQTPLDQSMDHGTLDLDVYGEDDFGQNPDLTPQDFGTGPQVLQDHNQFHAHHNFEVFHTNHPDVSQDYAPQPIQTVQDPAPQRESTEMFYDGLDDFQDPILEEIQQQIHQNVYTDENGNHVPRPHETAQDQIDMNQEHLIIAQDRPTQDFQLFPNIQKYQPSTGQPGQSVYIDENGNQVLCPQAQDLDHPDLEDPIPVDQSQEHQKQDTHHRFSQNTLIAQDRQISAPIPSALQNPYPPRIQEQHPSKQNLPVLSKAPGPYRLTHGRLLTTPYSTKPTVPKKGSHPGSQIGTHAQNRPNIQGPYRLPHERRHLPSSHYSTSKTTVPRKGSRPQKKPFVGLIPPVLQTRTEASWPRRTPNPNFIEIQIWRNDKNQKPTEHLPRPPISYQMLAMLACMNSPTKSVTTQEAYSFLLHHFPYYRFVADQDSWKSSVRNALCSEKYFWKISRGKELMYKIRSAEAVGFTREEWAWIEADPRGREFFSKMALGQVGLPRQLFYTIIGIGCPQYAGPENSALFYHLWSLGLDFNDLLDDNPFRIHVSQFEGAEPVFDEEHEFLNGKKKVLVEKRFGYAVNLEDGIQTDGEKKKWSMEENSKFFENLHWYFEQMEEMKRRNMENWTTPSVVRTNFLVSAFN